MTASDLLIWLQLADPENMSETELRTKMEAALRQASLQEANERLRVFLDEISEQLQSEHFEFDRIAEWPELYQDLLPDSLKAIEEGLLLRVDEVSDTCSPRMKRFQILLSRTDTASLRELEKLEEEIAKAWDEYRAEPVEKEADAEALAAHNFLAEGFECWFEAFDLAYRGKAEEALAAALEGNRLLTVVAQWSDELTQGEPLSRPTTL